MDPRTAGPRRELAAAVLGLVLGAGAVLFAASRVWLVETQLRAEPLPALEVARTGGSLYPALPALALVALAGAGGILATRGRARAVVGVLIGLSAVGVMVLLVAASSRPVVAYGWVALAFAGAVLCAGATALTTWRGQNWPGMGSRYRRARRRSDAPSSEPTARADSELWDALDRGEDPTR